MGVLHTPQGLFFCNGLEEIIQDGSKHLICCDDQEIGSGEFLMFFFARASYAALAELFAQEFVRRELGGLQ